MVKVPTKKRRIALTVDDDLNGILDELSRLTQTPKSTIIVDFLKDAKPHLKDIVDALKLVEDKKSAVPIMSKLTAMANQQVAIVNNEMADMYKKQIDWVEGEK